MSAKAANHKYPPFMTPGIRGDLVYVVAHTYQPSQERVEVHGNPDLV